MRTFSWTFLSLVIGAAVVACTTADSTAGPFKDPIGTGKEECVAYSLSTTLGAPACETCVHEKCANAYQVVSAVCPDGYANDCTKNFPNDTVGYCSCMVTKGNSCGPALGNVYSCFADQCAKECGTKAVVDAGVDSGKDGAAGAAGDGGKTDSATADTTQVDTGYAGQGGSTWDSGYPDSWTDGGVCELQTGISSCDNCINNSCYSECDSCVQNADCVDLLNCLGACADNKCQQVCMSKFPEGYQILMSFVNGCMNKTCGQYCK